MSSSSAQEFLNSVYKEKEDNNIEESRSKISTQQKAKYIAHWYVLIAAHMGCFWYLPISGNMKLYGQAACDVEQ